MSSFAINTTYTVIDCYKCGAQFAVPTEVDDALRQSGRIFYCPNGHDQHYTDSLQARLKKERDAHARTIARLDQTRADRDAIERSRRATKGQLTRVKKRVAHGVCPCCNRTFPNLAAHMQEKHPGYAPEAVQADEGTES